jgi:two-component system OmpR family response regulator/two-component system response regulator QseB
MRILLIEDDMMLGRSLQKALDVSGYSTEWLTDGEAALLAMKTSSFAMIILDVNLPVMNGLDFLKELRASGNLTPVLILTALDNISSRVTGLDLGADDYIAKPFDLDELLARVRALIRRARGKAESIIKCGEVELNITNKSVTFKGENIMLPAREYKLLAYLMETAGRMVSKADIEELLYGWEEEFESNTVEVLIYKLRKKFGNSFIKTMRGVGYMVAK